MSSGVGELMCLGVIVDLVIEVYLFLYPGRTAVCHWDSARDQLAITQNTRAYRNQSLIVHCVKDNRKIPSQNERG